MADILADIERAFAGVAPDSNDRLLHPLCMDDVDVAPFYGWPDWRRLPDEMIVNHWWAFSSFSPEAFRYYLPAFMLWSLRHPDVVEYAPEATIRALNPGTTGEMLRDFQLSKFALFSAAQRRTIVRFLETFAEHPGLSTFALEALANYWLEQCHDR